MLKAGDLSGDLAVLLLPIGIIIAAYTGSSILCRIKIYIVIFASSI